MIYLIWKQKIPPRVRMMVGRACMNVLSTCANLRNQGLVCPLTGTFKYNIDASFFDLQNCTGISYCIIDNFGEIFMAATEWKHPCFSVLEGEAWALWSALQFANNICLTKVLFESNCKILVDKVNA